MLSRKSGKKVESCASRPNGEGLKGPQQDRIEKEAIRICEEIRARLDNRDNDRAEQERILEWTKTLSKHYTIEYKFLLLAKAFDGPKFPAKVQSRDQTYERALSENYLTLEGFIRLMRYSTVMGEVALLFAETSESFSDADLKKILVRTQSLLEHDFAFQIATRLEDENGNEVKDGANGYGGDRSDQDYYEVPVLNHFEETVRQELEAIVRREGRLAIW